MQDDLRLCYYATWCDQAVLWIVHHFYCILVVIFPLQRIMSAGDDRLLSTVNYLSPSLKINRFEILILSDSSAVWYLAESWTSVGRGCLSISSRILPFFGFFSSSFPTPILLFPPQSRHSRRAMVKKILVKGFPSLSLSVSLFSGVLQSKDLALTNWVWGKRREKLTERRRMERQGDKIYVWGEGVHEWMDEWIQLYDSWVYAFLFSARINREGEGVSKFTSGRIALLSFFVFSSCNGVPTG